MIGRVVVMEPHDYQTWLAGEASGPTLMASGADLFTGKACSTCHRPDSAALAPLLTGLLGRAVLLQDGRTLIADEGYLRESILQPQAKIVAGYQPIMPTFKGQLSEEDLVRLISYIKGLAPPGEGTASAGGGTAPGEAVPQGGTR